MEIHGIHRCADLKLPAQTQKNSSSLHAGVVVRGIKSVAIGIVQSDFFVEGIERTQQGVLRHEVQQVPNTEIPFYTMFTITDKLQIYQPMPGRILWSEIIGNDRQAHGAE